MAITSSLKIPQKENKNQNNISNTLTRYTIYTVIIKIYIKMKK
jgi:hypothetical protein